MANNKELATIRHAHTWYTYIHADKTLICIKNGSSIACYKCKTLTLVLYSGRNEQRWWGEGKGKEGSMSIQKNSIISLGEGKLKPSSNTASHPLQFRKKFTVSDGRIRGNQNSYAWLVEAQNGSYFRKQNPQKKKDRTTTWQSCSLSGNNSPTDWKAGPKQVGIYDVPCATVTITQRCKQPHTHQ